MEFDEAEKLRSENASDRKVSVYHSLRLTSAICSHSHISQIFLFTSPLPQRHLRTQKVLLYSRLHSLPYHNDFLPIAMAQFVMLSAIPIAKDVPDGLKESLTMEEVEIAHIERPGKTEQKSKMSIKGTDTIDPSKSAGHDLESLNIAATTKSTCKPRAAPVVALKALDKNRHSSRARKSVGTYNVKALAGTAVHTPRKFNKDENGQDKAGSLKTVVRVPAGILSHIPDDIPINFRSYKTNLTMSSRSMGRLNGLPYHPPAAELRPSLFDTVSTRLSRSHPSHSPRGTLPKFLVSTLSICLVSVPILSIESSWWSRRSL